MSHDNARILLLGYLSCLLWDKGGTPLLVRRHWVLNRLLPDYHTYINPSTVSSNLLEAVPPQWWSWLWVLFFDLWLRLGDDNGTLQMETGGGLWGCPYTSGGYDVVVSRDVSTLSGGVLRY